ncbi:MAG TPA: VCBS repeat-containing protein, partial [Candidatus Paceibacterota bacterium]|nr:VCBS repeat-containing protein [Candidatus Paceibacterota bacterium]
MKTPFSFLLAFFLMETANAQVTFAPYVNYPIANNSAEHLATGDFNNDGLEDVAVTTGFDVNANAPFRYKILVYLQNGITHTLNAPVIYPYNPVYPGARAMSSGDINGDGLADIVVGYSDSIACFFQNNFGTMIPGPVLRIGNTVDAVEIGDAN